MTIVAGRFKSEYANIYDTKFGNDMDEQGYIIGIVLTLDHGNLLNLVMNQTFKIIQIEWWSRTFHVITFDNLEHVFKSDCVMYKLTDKEEAFVNS
ncbi:MAG: hypothetical protein ACQEXV_00295 [Bacillota bacterium]